MLGEKKYFGLTEAQKRIWYTQILYQNSCMFNIGGTVTLTGKIDIEVLRCAISALINAHDVFQIRITVQNNEPIQYFDDSKNTKEDIKFVDLRKCGKIQFEEWVRENAVKPFVLEESKLYEFIVYQLSENKFGYLIKLHHLIADGWSVQVLTNEVSSYYEKLMAGQAIESRSEYLYKDFIFSEKEYFNSKKYLKNKEFWISQYRNFPKKQYNFSDQVEGKRKTYFLSKEKTKYVREFCNTYKISENAFFISVFMLYTYAITGNTDVTVGTPVLGRNNRKERNVIGMFVSSIPVRYQFCEGEGLLQTIKNISNVVKNCHRNQRYPLNQLIKDLHMDGNAFYNCCVNYYGTKMCTHFAACEVENKEFYNGQQEYDIQLIIREWDENTSLQIDVDYKKSKFKEAEIDDFINRCSLIMNQIFKKNEQKICHISLISEEEKKKFVLDYNNTKYDYGNYTTVLDMYYEQVRAIPNEIALEYGAEKLSYEEVDKRSDKIKQFLQGQGVLKGEIVGLYTYNSIESIIAILGILKAGLAYLPLDLKWPMDRMEFVLQDAKVKILLTNIKITGKLKDRVSVYDIEEVLTYTDIVQKSSVENIEGHSLAYIIYTSGSTGKPKGVMIEHIGLLNYVQWGKKMYTNGKERFAFYSNLAFDLTVTSIFVPLVSGSTIVVYNEHDQSFDYVLKRIIKENKVTIVKLTPAHLSLIKDMNNKNSTIKRFIVGGEDLKRNLACQIYESFGGDIEIYNEYGPTETVVGCMIYKFDYQNDTRGSVAIGVPADNMELYILDKNLNMLPPGIIGEMYISGFGVARGYVNRPDLTAERFIENPFDKSKRMYKTGDLARFLPDGNMEYVGRIDQQVKISGYRIELGEIENQLIRHEAIKDSVVMIRKDRYDNSYLCAFYVKSKEITQKELEQYMSEFLPEYMVPKIYVEIEEFKLTVNGKIDRKQLSNMEVALEQNTDYVEGRNEQERVLIEIVGEVLNRDNISVTDNIYRIGGDSIKAIQIASKLNELGYKIRVKDILTNSVIENLAQLLSKEQVEGIPQANCTGNVKLPPIAFWFFSQNFFNVNYYNQSVTFELSEKFGVQDFEKVLNYLIQWNDSLRLNYNREMKELFYNMEHLNHFYNITEYDLRGNDNWEEELQNLSIKLKSNFNIAKDILIRACSFLLPNNKRKILITAHHLVVDGVSWRILFEQIDILLEQIIQHEELKLPNKTHSYQKWVENQYESATLNEIKKDWNYWNEVIEKDSFDYLSHVKARYRDNQGFNKITCSLNVELTNKLQSQANIRYETETNELLMTALFRTIKQIFETEGICIELEGHGRDEIGFELNISRTVGWFTSIYPLYIRFTGSEISEQIEQVKLEYRKVPNHGISYGILKYLSNSQNEWGDKRRICFNYLGDFDQIADRKYYSISEGNASNDISQENHLSSIFDIDCLILHGTLNISIKYEINEFQQSFIEEFMQIYKMEIEELVEHCCNFEGDNTIQFDTVNISEDDLHSILDSL